MQPIDKPANTLALSPVLTAQVAGSADRVLAGGQIPSVIRNSLMQVIQFLALGCKECDGSLRILTGVSGAVDAYAAEVAEAEQLPLQLLAAGLPVLLSTAQLRAERQVWLGADAAECESGKPMELRSHIALGFSDLLIHVWDAAPLCSGLEGEQDRMLLAAVLAMKPVIWIDLSGAVRLLERSRLTQAKRHLLQCPMPQQAALVDCFSDPLDPEHMAARLREIVASDLAISSPEDGKVDAVQKKSTAGAIHKIMLALLQGKLKKAFSAVTPKAIKSYRGPAWSESLGLVAPTPALDAQFDKADVAATFAAGKHRSSAWVSAILATMAVFAAVAGAIQLWVGDHSAVWSVLELVLISLVITLLWQAKDQKWHSNWTGNRFVAEQLRYTRMGLPLLAVAKSLHQASSTVSADRNGGVRLEPLSEDLRVLQQTVARMGLPADPSGGPYIAAAAANLHKLRDCVHSVVCDQIAYHEHTHHEHHVTGHVLHTFSLLLFCLTGAAVIGHFFLHASWLLICTAFFPALAAGIHGLSTTLEISRVADQSKATAESLRHLRDAISIVLTSTASTWHQWLQLRHLTLLSSEIMSDENAHWQKLVTHQKPNLPA